MVAVCVTLLAGLDMALYPCTFMRNDIHAVVSNQYDDIILGTSHGMTDIDPAVMEEVFTDMQKTAPSDSYGLILGSHATGWMKGNSVQSKAFGDDGGYNIDIPDLANVLKKSFSEKIGFRAV